MNTKILSQRSLSVINQYMDFVIGKAHSNIPYFNNKTSRSRGALRAYIGKGSPKEIHEEVMACLTKEHAEPGVLTDENLKRYLVNKNIGIDCSGLAYYILNAESQERKKGSLDKNIKFVACQGFVRKIRCALRPVENCDVFTLAHDANSHVIAQAKEDDPLKGNLSLKDLLPGDFITLIGQGEEADRDHILVIHQIEYQNFIPKKIHYTHSIAYPEDGIYGTGARQGTIDLVGTEKDILEGIWSEDGRLMNKLRRSKIEIRRLNCF
jgi:hypothetical protein